tara:strand:- start:3108 stop:4055 length:948 start_codon:yes stop_codon:yes gene_type:complete
LKTINVLFYTLLLTCFTACGNSLKEKYKFATESIKNKEFEVAISMLNEVIYQDSTIYQAYQSRAFCYYNIQAYKKAIIDNEKAYELSKNDQLHYNIGMNYFKIGKFNLALESFNKFEKTDTSNPNLWIHKAICFSKVKNYNAAIKYYKKAYHSFSDSISILKEIGVCYFQVSNYSKAIETLEEYKTANNEDSSVHEMMAFSYHQLGQYQKAKINFDLIIKLGMEIDENTRNLVIKNLIKLGQNQYNKKAFMKALLTFSEAVALDPINAEGYFNRGLVQLHYKKRKEACEDFNLAFLNGHPESISIMKENCEEYFE